MESKPVVNTAEPPEVPLVEPDSGVFETYANLTDADWSLTDVTIRFMQISFIPKEEGATTKNRELAYLEKANITMPWRQVKLLAHMLGDLVSAYESTNGELKDLVLPPHPSAANKSNGA